MKFYCVKHLWSIIIYIFLLLIGVTELRSVHVHMINLSNNGNGFDRERMIVLTRTIWSNPEQYWCLCFNLHFFKILFQISFNPFPHNLYPFFKIRNKETKKTKICSFCNWILRLVRLRSYNQALCPPGKIKHFFRGRGYFCKIGGFILSLVIMRPIALLRANQK